MTYINKGNALVKLDKLFVYGIFLAPDTRAKYGMTNPSYDTVADFVTFGTYIVEAVPIEKNIGVALTGLVVDVDPDRWDDIDSLEAGYERIMVETVNNGLVYMYAAKGTLAALAEEERNEQEI